MKPVQPDNTEPEFTRPSASKLPLTMRSTALALPTKASPPARMERPRVLDVFISCAVVCGNSVERCGNHGRAGLPWQSFFGRHFGGRRICPAPYTHLESLWDAFVERREMCTRSRICRRFPRRVVYSFVTQRLDQRLEPGQERL